VFLQVLLVLLKRGLALFEASFPLFVVLLDAGDGVVLALDGRVRLCEVGLGLVELLAKLLEGDLWRVIGVGRGQLGTWWGVTLARKRPV